MIASITGTWTGPDCCPNCGMPHFNQTQIISFPYPTISSSWGSPARPMSKAAKDLRKALEHCEAIGRSRLLMVAPRPEPIVRRLSLAALNPQRVHEARCTNRRPRLSLLERVKAELSRRRS